MKGNKNLLILQEERVMRVKPSCRNVSKSVLAFKEPKAKKSSKRDFMGVLE
jgi:hypothetical protein